LPKRVLFWLSDEFLYFCIAKYLQKKHVGDFFGIVEDNNLGTKKFYDKQKFVKFEKLWFLREHSSVQYNKPDFDYLKSIEKKYNIDLWKIAYSERLFHQEFNPFHKFTSTEILNIIKQYCVLFENILDETKPDFYIANVITRLPGYLFYLLCKARNIEVQTLESSNFSYLVFISNTITSIGNPEKYVDYKVEHQRSLKELLELLTKYKPPTQVFRYKSQVPKLEKYKAAFDFLLHNPKQKEFWRNYGTTKRKTLMKKSVLSFKLKKTKRESFMKKNLVDKLPSREPFVYFPLHAEPERNTLVSTPYYTNQITVIENIAKSLPIDYTLYVKDHPSMGSLGWRDSKYYMAIMKYPNVKLLHPSIDSAKIIKNASLIISVFGTTAFEAAFYNKPSIVLSDVDFSVLPFIYKVKNYDELTHAIKNMVNQKVDVSHLNQYVEYIFSKSIPFDREIFYNNFNNNFYYKGYSSKVEIPTDKMKVFLEDNEELLNEVVLGHIQKLQTSYIN